MMFASDRQWYHRWNNDDGVRLSSSPTSSSDTSSTVEGGSILTSTVLSADTAISAASCRVWHSSSLSDSWITLFIFTQDQSNLSWSKSLLSTLQTNGMLLVTKYRHKTKHLDRCCQMGTDTVCAHCSQMGTTLNFKLRGNIVKANKYEKNPRIASINIDYSPSLERAFGLLHYCDIRRQK